MNNAIAGNKYVVKGFHKVSDRYDDSQRWVGEVVECLYSDGYGTEDNTCACRMRSIKG